MKGKDIGWIKDDGSSSFETIPPGMMMTFIGQEKCPDGWMLSDGGTVETQYGPQMTPDFTSILASYLASFICIFSMCFIVGAYNLKIWIEPSLILSVCVFPSLIKGHFSYYAKLSCFGFASGAFAFPLDWPVTWKKPPIFNIFLMTIFGLIGIIIDHFYS